MGRPPTSGYCHTCRKRRIKCDKARPACQRCIKSGYTCKGYDLGLRMQSLVVVTEPDSGSQRLARIIGPPQGHGSRGRAGDKGGRAPGRELSLAAFQEQMAFTYFFGTYSWAGFWKPFLHLSREVDDLAQVSHTGALALAYGHMGLGHNAQDLQSQGIELYSRSMHEVQSLLTQRTAGSRKDVARLAVPVVILGMYSYAVDKDLRLVHHLGVAQILQHCGPESFQEEPLLTTFRTCRALLICQSFGLRRRTFMEEPEWKAVPYLKLGKTWLDKLLDVLADIPGVVHDMNASERPVSPTTKIFFNQRVKSLMRQLRDWRWEWERGNPGAAKPVPCKVNMEGVETPVFKHLLSTSLEFKAVSQAVDILTYNAGLIYLMQLEDILGIGEPHNETLTSADLEAIRHATDRHPSQPLLLPGEAKFLCQPAVEGFRLLHFLRDNLLVSNERVMVILSPMGVLYCALRSHPELGRAMVDTLLNDIPFFKDAPRELSVYELTMSRDWLS